MTDQQLIELLNIYLHVLKLGLEEDFWLKHFNSVLGIIFQKEIVHELLNFTNMNIDEFLSLNLNLNLYY